MQTKKIVQMGLLIALQVVISRFLSINTPIVKIGFGFLPIVIAAILFGPIAAALGAAMGDFIGAILFPVGSGAYFFGFTLSIAIAGLIYGLFLYKKEIKLPRVIICVLLVNIITTLLMNTYWLYMLTGKAFMVMLPSRIGQALIMIPIQTVTIYFADKMLKRLNLK